MLDESCRDRTESQKTDLGQVWRLWYWQAYTEVMSHLTTIILILTTADGFLLVVILLDSRTITIATYVLAVAQSILPDRSLPVRI